jgi:hypothetical protein
MDKARGVGRCLVEIGDAALRGSAGVDGEMGAPDKPLISSDRAEFIPISE